MRELTKNQAAALAYLQLFNAGQCPDPKESDALQAIAENRLKDLGYPVNVAFDNEGEPMIIWGKYEPGIPFNWEQFTSFCLDEELWVEQADLRNLESWYKNLPQTILTQVDVHPDVTPIIWTNESGDLTYRAALATYPKGKGPVHLTICEFRHDTPIMCLNWKIYPETGVLDAEPSKQRYFPIDEEDEEDTELAILSKLHFVTFKLK
jgi:hypothetical protein